MDAQALGPFWLSPCVKPDRIPRLRAGAIVPPNHAWALTPDSPCMARPRRLPPTPGGAGPTQGQSTREGKASMTDRQTLAALAARDVCRAIAVLTRLARGPATNCELRRAAGWPGDSFRSLLRQMEQDSLILRTTMTGRGRLRWTLATRAGPTVAKSPQSTRAALSPRDAGAVRPFRRRFGFFDALRRLARLLDRPVSPRNWHQRVP